jgi:hypothetical protein
VIVPVRDEVDVLAATVNATVPLPLKDAPLVTVIQAALLVADQAQPLVVVTAIVELSPLAGEFRLTGEIENVQGAPAWVTVKVWPATVSVPVRDEVDVLAATVNATVPLPLPEAPLVTVIHAALLVAVQAQPLVVVTATVELSPAAGEFQLAGAMEKVHGTPDWVTVNV